jgi:dipeptidyl aminopeptidase/acylaminoacyl peptidase
MTRIGISAGSGASDETDLTWLDWSLIGDLSTDGRTVLFSEAGEGGGPGYSVYLRQVGASAAIRLGEGNAQSISPDGKQVLAIVHPTAEQSLVSYPTGAGETKVVSPAGFQVRGASWMPDGRRIVFNAIEPGRDVRSYVMDAAGGKPRPLLPDGYRSGLISTNGKRVVARGPERRYYVCPVEGGDPVPIPGITQDTDTVIGWVSGDRSIYVRRGSSTALPARVVRLDLATGQEEKWRDLLPADSAGLNAIEGIKVTPDGSRYAYSYYRALSNLYLAQGIK